VRVWRFRGPETAAALAGCGPLRRSFLFNPEGMPLGSLTSSAFEYREPWRAVGANRFVPRRSARSAAFVEWRRERGRWVVAAFGDESYAVPRLVGAELSDVMRQPPPAEPPEPVYATGQTWFEHNEPFRFNGHLYVKFGMPRPRESGLLEPVGWRGRMRVCKEAGAAVPVVLYVPVGPGIYQSFQGNTVDQCDSPV
jgi:hypothetical protein